MAELTKQEIAQRFSEFCGKDSLLLQGLEMGVMVTCPHGRFAISYKYSDVSFSNAKRDHEKQLSSSRKTRYNWYQ